MRQFCSFTLICEAIVICFAALVATRLTDVPTATLWWVAGGAAVLCVLLCGMLGRPWSVWVGWAVQAGLIASGALVPVMYVLGVAFAGIWFAAVWAGRRVDAVKAQRAAEAEADAGAGATPAPVPEQSNPANRTAGAAEA